MKNHGMVAGLLAAGLVLFSAGALRAVPFHENTVEAGPEAEAMAYLNSNQPALAIETLKKALVKTPDVPRLHYYLGIAFVRDGKPDLAEAEFRSVLRLDPDFVEAHIQLAGLSARKVARSEPKEKNLAAIEGAIKELQQAVKKNPNDNKVYYNIAALYVDSVQFRTTGADAAYAEALKVLQAVKARTPEEVNPYVAIGNLRVNEAQHLAGDKKFADLDAGTAKKYNALLDDATASFQKALEIDPSFLAALDQIARIHNTRGDLDGAIKVLEQQLSKLRTEQEKAACLRRMAQYYVGANKLSEAETKLDLAIQTDPKDLGSYLILAGVQQKRDMQPQAMETLQKAVKENAKFLNGYVEMGQIEYARRNYTDAAKQFEAALNIQPAEAVVVTLGDKPIQNLLYDLYAVAAVRLGDIRVAQQNFDDAILVFQRFAALASNSPLPEFKIGEVYRIKGDAETAAEHYRLALKRDKSFVEARAALAELAAAEMRSAANARERADILKRAIGEYETALASRPNTPGILDRLADLRARLALCSTPPDRAVLEQALADAKEAVKLAPEALMFQQRLAFVQHQMGNDKDAVAGLQKIIGELEKLAAKEPDNVRIVFEIARLNAAADEWQPDKAVFQKALDGYEAVVKKQPDFYDGYLQAAMLLENKKEFAKAADWFKRLLDSAKGDSSLGALNNVQVKYVLHAAAELAWINAEYLNNLEAARNYANMASTLNANLPSLIDTIGWIEYKAGAYDKAILQLRRAYKAAPGNATVGYHLALALAKSNNPDRAKEVLREAAKNVGTDKELEANIQKLLKSLGG